MEPSAPGNKPTAAVYRPFNFALPGLSMHFTDTNSIASCLTCLLTLVFTNWAAWLAVAHTAFLLLRPVPQPAHAVTLYFSLQ